jgi:hypothetical protein
MVQPKLRKTISAGVFLVLLGLAPLASATPLGIPQDTDLHLFESAENWARFSFLGPNEVNAAHAREVYQAAPPGVHISVGTERGFMGAIMNRNASHLVLIDRDPNVVIYNRINTALLAVASSRREYLRLRSSQVPAEWKAALQEARAQGGLATDPAVLNLLESLEAHQLWSYFQNFHADDFRRFYDSGYEGFQGVNYLYNETAFARIQSLAREGNISSIPFSLGNASDWDHLIPQIQSQGLSLSALDISNAWEERYLKPNEFTKLLKRANRIASPDSLLVITQTGRHRSINWSYAGLRFQSLGKDLKVAAAALGKDPNPFRQTQYVLDPPEYLAMIRTRYEEISCAREFAQLSRKRR